MTNATNEHTTLEPGVLIDHGSRTVDELNADTIELARDHGWRGADPADLREIRRLLMVHHGEAGLAYWHPSATEEGVSEALGWVADDAIEYLNELAPDGCCVANDGEAGVLGVWELEDDEPRTIETEGEAIRYLSRDGGRAPCSRYGTDSASCAPVAWAAALILVRETEGGDPTTEDLEYMMGLVVNDHDDPETLIREHGAEHGIDPADYLEDEDDGIDDDERDAYRAYVETVGEEYATAEGFRDAYRGSWDSVEDYAAELIEDCGVLDGADEVIVRYFDYEAFARDLVLGGDVSVVEIEGTFQGVYVFDAHA